jgi:hypothetical protein
MDDDNFIAIDFGSKSIKVCREVNGRLVFVQHMGGEHIANQAQLHGLGLKYFNNSLETTKEPMISEFLQFFAVQEHSSASIHDLKILNGVDDVYSEDDKTYFRYRQHEACKIVNNRSILVSFIRFLVNNVIKSPKKSYVLVLPNHFKSEVKNYFYSIFKSLKCDIANIYTTSEAIEEYFIQTIENPTETNIIIDVGYSDVTVSIVYKSHDGFKRRERRHFNGLGYKILQRILYKNTNKAKTLGHRNEMDNFFFVQFLKEIQIMENRINSSENVILENSLNHKQYRISYADVISAVDDYFMSFETVIREIKTVIKAKIGVPCVFLISNLQLKYFKETLLSHLSCSVDNFTQTDSKAVVKGLHAFHKKMKMIGSFSADDKMDILKDLRLLSRIDFYTDEIKRLKMQSQSSSRIKQNAGVFDSFTLVQSTDIYERRDSYDRDEEKIDEYEDSLKAYLSKTDSLAKLNPYSLMLPYFHLLRSVIGDTKDENIDIRVLETNGPHQTRIFLNWLSICEASFFNRLA